MMCLGCGQLVPLSEEEKVSIRKASDALINAFIWSDSREGFEYWSQINKRLTRLYRGADTL
jgi:hypothetical protein